MIWPKPKDARAVPSLTMQCACARAAERVQTQQFASQPAPWRDPDLSGTTEPKENGALA